MKVNRTGPQADQAGELTKTGRAEELREVKERRRGGKSQDATRIESNDKVDISNKARDANKAKELAKNAPDLNAEKLARLKEMIEGGNYKVDADKVADRMVDEHLKTML